MIPPKPPLPPAVVETERDDVVETKELVDDADAGEPVAFEDGVAEPEAVDPALRESDVMVAGRVDAEPVDAEPVDVEQIAETPVHAEPAHVELDPDEPVYAEPVHPVPPQAIDVDPLESLVVEPESAGTGAFEVPAVLVAASVDPATAALVVKGVTKAFGETRAVDGIDLTVPAGTFYGLVGPNGAGKTTTLSMIAGLLRPDRGSIRVNGIDAAADPLGAKRQMGVLPDRLRTFDRLTGRQLLHYYGVLRGLPTAVVESRTADLARAFDLSDSLGRVVSDYSAGMLKKVMLAGALIHSPRLLVLDEPFESVDPVSSAIILDILSTYVDHGGTVILSSHGMELVERVCSRVAVIVAGQVLAEGTVDEVRGELTLEQRFIELAGGLSDVEGLEWLHTFSD
ncbi:MAG: ATP-binding cassette domain-containing protein [Microbacterium sp.]